MVVKILFFFTTATAQQWMANLPQEKVTSDEVTFIEVQRAFNDYWAPKDVKNGYYFVNGEKIKAGGWKQFKRWEWFWNDRVNPETGAFPQTTALAELNRYLSENPVLKSTNGGSTGNWTSMGPSTTAGGYAGLGRLSCVAFSPVNNNVIYVGAASGGLWKSINAGAAWLPMSDNTAVLGISDLAVVNNGIEDVVYAATGDRDASDNYSVGVLKSTDGGNTWNTTGLSWQQSSLKLIYRLLADPANADVLYAATSDGVYKTTDGGNLWMKLTTSRFINIQFKPQSNQVMYGSTISTGDIYLSTNGGTTWTLALNTAGTRVELAVTAANPELVYALISNTSNGLLGVYKSIDSGVTFAAVCGSVPNMLAWNCDGSDTGGQGWYDLCIAADPANADVVFVGGVNTWKTTNGGASWSISNMWSGNCSGAATNVHADKHYFAFQPGTTNLFECNDGGLYKTSNTGATWTHLGSGLVISQIYKIGVSQTNSGDVMAGLQDNGTKAMISNTWKDVIGGDGMECLVDFTNTNVQYGSLYYGGIYRTDNHWASSTYISGSITGSAGWVTPYVIDPNDNNTLYAGFQDVWKSSNKGASWLKLSAWSGATLRSIAVAPSASNTIYAATGSILYRTVDGGATWANITGTLPVGTSNITYVSVKQDDPNTVWVSLGQFNAYGVFQTADGGVTWTDLSAGLPSIPVNCVIQNKQSVSQVELYAATDVGVFMKLGTAPWIPYFTGLPNVVVMELEIYYASDPSMSKLRAGTYGRGLWESDVFGTTETNSPPAFTADPNIEADGAAGVGYSATLADNATDPDADVLTFSLVSGPAWLSVAGNGNLSGTPAGADAGLNSFEVKVADGNGGVDQTILQINVAGIVVLAPVAGFSANPVSITAGQTVQFTDLSLNTPTGWLWSFGDGNTSASQNPSNTYSVAGKYTVTLTATNLAGSDVKTLVDFITVAAATVDYCTPAGINNSSDYIKTITVGGVVNSTGMGSSGYLLYDSPVFNLTTGRSNPVLLTPFKATNKNYWKIWIDFNNDGDFTDAGENVFTASKKLGAAKGNLVIPATASGLMRMRIAMRTGAVPNPCDNNYGGEVEDYSVNILKRASFDGGIEILADESENMPELRVYPNPVNSQLNISVASTEGKAVLRVFNITGVQLDMVLVNSELMQLDVSGYPCGVYFITLTNQNQRVVQKFVKE